MKKILHSDYFLLFLVSALAYLPFIPQFGYFNDDWYHIHTVSTQGAAYFNVIFGIDRPMRAWVMIPAYLLFGNNPLYYNLAAYVFRLAGGLVFLWILRQTWTDRRATFSAALLFLVYPGFLVQPNAIDYLSHIFGLAAGMTSIALTVNMLQTGEWRKNVAPYVFSTILGVLYLGQMEWYIGLEVLRFGLILILALRRADTLRARLVLFFKQSLPAAVSPALFLIWRIFFFHSERGATDVDMQLTGFRAAPFTFLADNAGILWNDILDTFLYAWWTPLQRLTPRLATLDWVAAFAVAAAALTLFAFYVRTFPERDAVNESRTRYEALLIGLGLLVFGLLPVVLVGRSVDFKSFSRYTLIASVGAALLWMTVFSFIARSRAREIVLGVFLLSAMLTHYANGLAHAQATQATRNFWWQVSWRVPQFERGTTLVASYAVVAEEDYFTWGPANLIYYPSQSAHAEYHQPLLYAALLNQETLEKVKAREPQDFSNRRGIRTYKNYRNILAITQPTPEACARVLDMEQIELSSKDDPRIAELAPYSEAGRIFYDESFHVPPLLPFGVEPPHTWCYYYEKASLARQMKNWDEVIRIGDEAQRLGYAAGEPVEWLPFLEAYARADASRRVEEIAPLLDAETKLEACKILRAESLSPAMTRQISREFCGE